MSLFDSLLCDLTRRTFLSRTATGLGAVALSELTRRTLAQAADAKADDRWRGVVQPLHHAAKAKRVIWLTMAGGPSHLETFDDKPKLAEMHGQPMPESLTAGQQIAQLQGQKLVGSAQRLAGRALLQHGAIPVSVDGELLQRVMPGHTPYRGLAQWGHRLQAQDLQAAMLTVISQ